MSTSADIFFSEIDVINVSKIKQIYGYFSENATMDFWKVHTCWEVGKKEKTASKFKNVDTIFSSQKFSFYSKSHRGNCSHHLQHQKKLC